MALAVRPLLDEGGRQHAVHRGLAGMHALEVAARHDPQPRGLGGTRGDRMLDLLVVEAHRARRRGGRTDMTGGAGDVPAGVVMRLAGGVPDPRLDLEPEREAGQGIAAGDRTVVGHGQDRRPHRAAAVHRRSGRVVHVVEIEHVRGERVEKGGERRRDPHLGRRQPLRRRYSQLAAIARRARRAASSLEPATVTPMWSTSARRAACSTGSGIWSHIVLGDEPGQTRCRIACGH